MKTPKALKVISLVVLAGLLVGALALAFPAIVQAQDTTPPAPTATPNAAAPSAPSAQTRQANRDARLEKVYQNELKQLDAQAKHLSAVDARVEKIAARIAALKNQGKNTSSLDAALSDFKSVLQTAHADHDSAASILKTHAGFDANGKVTNAQLALDTVQEARQQLNHAAQSVRPTLRDILQAIRQFIRDNRKV